jgi:general secretion pathway protein H
MVNPAAKAMTPTSAPGSKQRCARAAAFARGFTLIELLVVVALLAIASASIALAMRDSAATRLEREAERLIALFESARAEARVSGLSVVWVPVQDSSGDQFRFVGLPPGVQLPRRWLGDAPVVEIAGNSGAIRLGPEPLIGAQQLALRLGDRRVLLSTDGLAPFELRSEPAQAAQ